jgi:hypothetical protein
MPARLPRRTGAQSGFARASAAGRRAWPVLLMAWERWQALPEEEKERYKTRAREAAAKGRTALQQARDRAGRKRR